MIRKCYSLSFVAFIGYIDMAFVLLTVEDSASSPESILSFPTFHTNWAQYNPLRNRAQHLMSPPASFDNSVRLYYIIGGFYWLHRHRYYAPCYRE